jgi:peptidoglycan/xylan/chitin deacetylase (PgdA/CDA1 family)
MNLTRIRSRAVTVAASLSVFALLTAVSSNAAPDPAIDRTEYLIAVEHYRDAADLVQSTPEPLSLQTHCARAILLLYTGRPTDASSEFETIRELTPRSEPLADYGEALCAMMKRDTTLATADLDKCVVSPDYAAHRPQIDLARAVLAAAQHDNPAADRICAGLDLPLAQEIVAMDRFRDDPASADSLSLISRPPWWLPAGIPVVKEIGGLHAVGAIDPARPRLLEPALSDSTDADAIAAMLLRPDGDSGAVVKAAKVSGQVLLSPTSKSFAPHAGEVVTYTIDGAVAATVGSGSFDYRWDTSAAANGPHDVIITISDNENNSTFSESARYDVENPVGGETDARGDRAISLDPADQAAIDDAWSILTLAPSYKTAETILAQAAASRHDRRDALIHFSIAAAIDPSFAGSLQQITAAYGEREPLLYKVVGKGHGVEPYAGANSPHPNSSLGIWRGNPSIKEVALTFDDGPSPTDTPPLLAALAANNVPATFFVVGIRAAAAPDLIRQMHAMGGEVEDHSFTHPNLDEATPTHIYEEILRNAVIVRALTGIWPHFVRPPGGQTNPHVLQSATACGMAGAFWTIDVLPAEESASPSGVVKYVLSRVCPGAVVLMHDGAYATTAAIPSLAVALRARGYKLVSLLQLARDAAEPN